MTYEQALKDHTYLWKTYGPAYNMSAGYVDQEDLAKLLKSPNKTTAKKCLIDQIQYFFDVGPEAKYGDTTWRHDPRVKEIEERYL